MAITLKDVALRAGVSTSAVSRSFTEGASVSPETRRRVEKAAGELGYSPSLIARSLTTKRTKLIGLVANNFQNPVFLQVFDMFTRELQRRGYRPLLVNLTDETDPHKSLSLLRQYDVDGVIIATSTLPADFASAYRRAGIPVIHTFGKYDETAAIHVVGIDNQASGSMAAQTLHDRGYRQVSVLGGPESATSTRDRLAGFRRRSEELGLELVSVGFADSYTYEAGKAGMVEMLQGPAMQAVFCGDDLICMGAMDAARARGLRIPEDIGFLGFNDMTMSAWDAYDLTTVHQPVNDIVLSSVELVVGAVENPNRSPELRLFPCNIVERKSLRPILAK